MLLRAQTTHLTHSCRPLPDRSARRLSSQYLHKGFWQQPHTSDTSLRPCPNHSATQRRRYSFYCAAAAAAADEEITEDEPYVEDKDGNPIPWSSLSYVEQLNTQFGVDDHVVTFNEGINGLPRVWIRHPNGQGIELYLNGACITQWVKPDGSDILFMRPDATFDAGVPINCGVQVVFPQFKEGLLPSDGFANQMAWEVVDSGWGASSIMDSSSDVEDPAPYVVLRLKHNEETLKMWPFKFDVLYKIEVMETDDVDDVKMDKKFVSDEEDEEDADIREMMGLPPLEPKEPKAEEPVEEVEEPVKSGRAAWREKMKQESYQLKLEDEPLETQESILNAQQQPYEGTGGHYSMEDEEDEEPVQARRTSSTKATTATTTKAKSAPEPAPAPAPARRRPGRPSKKAPPPVEKVVEEDEEDEAEELADRVPESKVVDDDLDDDEGADDDKEPEDWRKIPLQLRFEFSVMNPEPAGGPDLEFNLGLLPMFAIKDLKTNEKFVRILGLGGIMGIDYYDSRVPRLFHNQEDFLHFRGQKVDHLFNDAADADVFFCPGTFTHLHLQLRKGFKDIHVFHPGDRIMQDGPIDHTRFWACLGGGHYLNTVKLKPQEQWVGEMVVRYHHKYWPDPVFPQWRENSAPPLPRFPKTSSKDDGLKVRSKGGSNEILDEGGNYYDGPEDDMEVAPSYTDDQD